jgi:hypothetical protein
LKNKPESIKELCEFIWYLENKYELLDLEIDNVKVWQSERMRIYYRMAEGLGILDHPHAHISRFAKVTNFFRYIKNSFRDNFLSLEKSDCMIISHPRTVFVDGEYIDIYTKEIIDELHHSSKVLEFEDNYLGTHRKRRSSFTHYTDWIALVFRFIYPFENVNISMQDESILADLEREIFEKCKINMGLQKYIPQRIKAFKALLYIYRKIFKVISPKTLYILVSYGKAPIIQAAKESNIYVIELQHGVFSRYHLGYSFPGREEPLDYFPDQFNVWSDYWKKLMDLPIDDEKVVIDRFRFLESQKEKYTHILKCPNQIVVLSQAALGEEMAAAILKHIDRFKEYSIKYKLHPEEYERWCRYPSLQKLSKLQNVEILKGEIPLYELFASSAIQIGVFSTALYEGVEFQCKTILIDLPGIEYMHEFIEAQRDVEVLR